MVVSSCITLVQVTTWIAMKLCSDIYHIQDVTPNDLGDRPTFTATMQLMNVLLMDCREIGVMSSSRFIVITLAVSLRRLYIQRYHQVVI